MRELENAVLHAIALHRGQEIGPESLPPQIGGRVRTNGTRSPRRPTRDDLSTSLTEAKRRAASEFEKRYLTRVMEKSKGSVSEAARLAGLDRTNFRRLLQRHGSIRDVQGLAAAAHGRTQRDADEQPAARRQRAAGLAAAAAGAGDVGVDVAGDDDRRVGVVDQLHAEAVRADRGVGERVREVVARHRDVLDLLAVAHRSMKCRRAGDVDVERRGPGR